MFCERTKEEAKGKNWEKTWEGRVGRVGKRSLVHSSLSCLLEERGEDEWRHHREGESHMQNASKDNIHVLDMAQSKN